MTKHLSFISFALCVAVGCMRTALAADVPKDFDELIKVLAQEERKLTNLSVKSEFWEEHLEEDGHWKPTGFGTVLTAYYNGMAGGPVRFDIAREVDPQEYGPEGPFESSYSVSFDGKLYKRVVKTGARKGVAFDMKEAEVLANRPTVLASGWTNFATGAGFSIYLCQANEGRSLSQYLIQQKNLLPADNSVPVTVESGKWHNVDTLVLTFGTPGTGQGKWWFDSRRSHALLAFHVIAPAVAGQKITMSYEIAKLIEAAPGIWYPSEATYLMPPDPDRGINRYQYTASAVVANDPNFDESIFSLRIPPGYTVDDKINHKIYQSAPTTRDLEKDFDKTIDDATRLSTPTTRPAGDPTSQGSDARPVRAGLPGIFGLVSAGSLGLVLRGKMRGVGILLASIILGSLSAVTQVRASPGVDASINQSAPTTTGLNHKVVMKIHGWLCSPWINPQQRPLRMRLPKGMAAGQNHREPCKNVDRRLESNNCDMPRIPPIYKGLVFI